MTSSCSVLDWFDTKSDITEPVKPVVEKPSDWTFFHEWQVENVNPSMQSLVPGASMTLTGQCFFSADILERLESNSKGLLVPVIKVTNDLTLSPDLENSARLYKVLRSKFPLGGVGDSLTFYQTLLSSIEHTCPANMTRDIDSCQFKKWMSFAGLGDESSIYDESRLKRWYKSHSSLKYIIMGSSDLFNSDALLSARYSANSRVITEQSLSVRENNIRPYLGKIRFDWVVPGKDENKTFNSLGSCTLSWKQLEEKRRLNGSGWIDTESLVEINKMLLPYFIELMSDATKAMPEEHR
ncbi:hypothetical protein GZ78_07830 [Endozoicomonas numazuensis]|uniref:Uncharacterized protein n=2 Tax=Endozoicomonas numazuensis TaxID=1137799 RepID=A0A081NMU3_9GAMM|nr:hypothetical protein GZ78_07830 [Endozoicomonas numazuensis]